MEGYLLPCERFSPMDDELLLYYLEPKVNGKPVPGFGKVIFEEDLYGEEDPWKTWKKYEAERANDLRKTKDLFFFTKLKNSSANRMKRTVGSGGTWKGQNRGKPVYLLDERYQKETTTLLGFKKTLTYKNDKSPQDGCWIMYQFDLDESRLIKNDNKANKKKDVYVLCVLRKNDDEKKTARKRGRVDGEEEEYPQEKRVRASFEGDQDQFLEPSASSQVEIGALVSRTTELEDDQVVQGGYGIIVDANWQDPTYSMQEQVLEQPYPPYGEPDQQRGLVVSTIPPLEVEPQAAVEQEQFLEEQPNPSSSEKELEALAAFFKQLEESRNEFTGCPGSEFVDHREIVADEAAAAELAAHIELGEWLSFEEEVNNEEQQPPEGNEKPEWKLGDDAVGENWSLEQMRKNMEILKGDQWL